MMRTMDDLISATQQAKTACLGAVAQANNEARRGAPFIGPRRPKRQVSGDPSPLGQRQRKAPCDVPARRLRKARLDLPIGRGNLPA